MTKRAKYRKNASFGKRKKVLADGQGARKRKPHTSATPRHLRAFRGMGGSDEQRDEQRGSAVPLR